MRATAWPKGDHTGKSSVLAPPVEVHVENARIESYLLVPYKKAGAVSSLQRKFGEKARKQVEKELKENGSLSLKTRILANPTLPGGLGALNRFRKSVLAYASAGSAAGAGGVAVLGIAISPWVIGAGALVGATAGAGFALWKTGKAFMECNEKVRIGAKEGAERAEKDLSGASLNDLDDYQAGLKRAEDVDQKYLNKKEIDKLPGYVGLGYAAHLLSKDRSTPAGAGAYLLSVKESMEAKRQALNPQALPPILPQPTSWVPQPSDGLNSPQATSWMPQPLTEASGQGGTAALGASGGKVHADPQAVRQVALALEVFEQKVEELKDKLLTELSTAREGWPDERGDRAEEEVKDLIAQVEVSEQVEAIKAKCLSFADKLDDLYA